MMSSQFLAHITLTTGHASRSYRDEVADDSVTGAQDLLRRAQYERVRMPALGPAIAMTVTSEGRDCMIATIWDGMAPVVTFGVARTNRSGAGLWRLLLRQSTGLPAVLDESSRPPAPWVAARIEIGAAMVNRDIMVAIGGLEAVFGWAFLEMQ